MLAHRHLLHEFRAAVVIILVIQLTACMGMQDRLYISSTTVLGLDASVNTARTAGRVQLGYDRYFVTWVPQMAPEGNAPPEVMSALNCTEVTVNGLTLTGFEESLATGEAAIQFAKALANEEQTGKKAYFHCFTDQP